MPGFLIYPVPLREQVGFWYQFPHSDHGQRIIGTVKGTYPTADASILFQEDEIVREIRLVRPVTPSCLYRAEFHTNLATTAAFGFIDLGLEV